MAQTTTRSFRKACGIWATLFGTNPLLFFILPPVSSDLPLRVAKNKGLACQSFAPALNKERIPEPHEFLESVVLNVEAGGLCKAFMIKDCKSSKSLLWFIDWFSLTVYCDCILIYDKYTVVAFVFLAQLMFQETEINDANRQLRSTGSTVDEIFVCIINNQFNCQCYSYLSLVFQLAGLGCRQVSVQLQASCSLTVYPFSVMLMMTDNNHNHSDNI